MRLTDVFFNRHALDVARDLLGKRLVFNEFSGVITETEAYRGSDDEASHASRGKTKRSTIMFGPPGYAYVYMIYGMYYCLNIVCEAAESPAAILIRGLQLPNMYLDGPGKICRELGITFAENGKSMLSEPNFYVTEGIPVKHIETTSRIGIRQAKEKLWRFVINSNVSPY